MTREDAIYEIKQLAVLSNEKNIDRITEALEMAIEALQNADRKTEPNSSEKPNNCKTEPRKEQNFCGKCRYLYRDFKYGLSCYRLMDNEPCKYDDRKTEPTISKMEQVDEPQYETGIGTLKCDNCSEYGSFKCTKCDGEMYFKRLEPKDEPQTERSE